MALNEEFTNTVKSLDVRDKVLSYLQTHRRQVMNLFTLVITETAQCEAGKKQKFADGVLEGLPRRFKDCLMDDFGDWASRYAGHIVTSPSDNDISDLSFEVEVIRGDGEVVLVLTDYNTRYTVRDAYRFEDLVTYLRAGLEWNPRARTFFIPRS
ncbi:hypothetical protein pEaSNUABM9_00180 [Erwinia phage pEa_SNUABM_9]|nr:hypothetical protein pEaSNUABM9_00180 [Erwinia phage pEa_SNUABM_9]